VELVYKDRRCRLGRLIGVKFGVRTRVGGGGIVEEGFTTESGIFGGWGGAGHGLR
jgi:hypothetical protein